MHGPLKKYIKINKQQSGTKIIGRLSSQAQFGNGKIIHIKDKESVDRILLMIGDEPSTWIQMEAGIAKSRIKADLQYDIDLT